VGPDVSVVIPTFNRRHQLERTLEGLAAQTGLEHDLEVIVVSDGSTDGTDEWLRSGAAPVPVSACFQPNSGPAAARNRGVAAATGALVLFLDDDVVPTPELVHTHVLHHRSLDDDLVVVGPMRTPDDATLSPWVKWEQQMLYKQYDAMLRGDWSATPRQFYTANASLARRHLESTGGFDPTFRRAEDVELAYRLADAGLTFTFVPEAVVLHYAERSFSSWRANASAYGHNDVIFSRDQQQAWLLDSIGREFHHRHRLVRTLTRVSLRHRRLGSVVVAAATLAARAASRTGPEKVTNVTLSAVYNLEYYRGMADELGDPRQLLARFDEASAAP
jgi:GT2 family glycosyltransferase